MARRGHHSLAQIKEMIILAAEELIEEGGQAQLRVRNIANKIGYTVGSIYMVFDSMDELILHLKGRTLDSIVQEMSQVSCHSTEQCLERLANVYIIYARQNLNRWSMVFEHRLPDSMEIPEWYQLKVNRLHNKFEEQFERLNPQISAQDKSRMALAFLGGVHGICVLMLTNQLLNFNENDLDESIDLLVRRFIHDGEVSANKAHKQQEAGFWPSLAAVDLN